MCYSPILNPWPVSISMVRIRSMHLPDVLPTELTSHPPPNWLTQVHETQTHWWMPSGWREWEPSVNLEIMKSLVLLLSGCGEWEPNSYIVFSAVNTHTQVPDAISYKTGGHFSADGSSFVRPWNLPTVGQNHITWGTGSGDLHVVTEQNQFVGKSMSSRDMTGSW